MKYNTIEKLKTAKQSLQDMLDSGSIPYLEENAIIDVIDTLEEILENEGGNNEDN